MVGAATEKARMPIFSLILGTETCRKTDDVKFDICVIK